MCDFLLVINNKLGPVSHHLAKIVNTDFRGHRRSMISISSKTAYDTSY